MRFPLAMTLALAATAASAEDAELARVEGVWADGTAYTAIFSRTEPDGMLGVMIYDPASASGEAGGDPEVANSEMSGISDEVTAEPGPDGTLLVKTRSVLEDQGVIFNEEITIGQWDGEIAVRRYRVLFGDPADPGAAEQVFCDADVAGGRIVWPSPDLQRDPALPIPAAAEMRLQDWTMNQATGLDPGLGLCIAAG